LDYFYDQRVQRIQGAQVYCAALRHLACLFPVFRSFHDFSYTNDRS